MRPCNPPAVRSPSVSAQWLLAKQPTVHTAILQIESACLVPAIPAIRHQKKSGVRPKKVQQISTRNLLCRTWRLYKENQGDKDVRLEWGTTYVCMYIIYAYIICMYRSSGLCAIQKRRQHGQKKTHQRA